LVGAAPETLEIRVTLAMLEAAVLVVLAAMERLAGARDFALARVAAALVEQGVAALLEIPEQGVTQDRHQLQYAEHSPEAVLEMAAVVGLLALMVILGIPVAMVLTTQIT
jgi:hypothetical protein